MSDYTNKTGTAVALGFFDGLHLAHRQVLAAAVAQREKGLTPCVLLFDDHPQHVLNGKTVPKLLQNEKRDALLTEMGLTAVNCSFERIRNKSPREFVSQVLRGELNAAFVSCGYNYRFGKNGEGDAAALKALCAAEGVEVCVCPEIDFEGEPVSSTAIRRLIENGEAEKVARLLGRPFSFSAEVIAGDRRGRLLGTPTVNQKLPDDMVIPRYGVYVSEVRFGGSVHTGVTNIGARPTFQSTEVRSETYILDFDGDLYGKTVETALVKYLRPVITFDSADALKAQIARDVQAAQAFHP